MLGPTLTSLHVADADAVATLEQFAKKNGFGGMRSLGATARINADTLTLDIDQRPLLEVLLTIAEKSGIGLAISRGDLMIMPANMRTPRIANTSFSGPLAVQLVTGSRQDSIELGGKRRTSSSVDLNCELFCEPSYAVLAVESPTSVSAIDANGQPLTLSLEPKSGKSDLPRSPNLRVSSISGSFGMRFVDLPASVTKLNSFKVIVPMCIGSGEKIVDVKDPATRLDQPIELPNHVKMTFRSAKARANLMVYEVEYVGDREALSMMGFVSTTSGRYGPFWMLGQTTTPVSGTASTSDEKIVVRYNAQIGSEGTFRMVLPEKQQWYDVPLEWQELAVP